jgi:glycosyltransferase involved in cell wall biosynthesis
MTLFRMIQLGYRVMKSDAFNVIVTQDPILSGMAGLLLRKIFRVPLCISLHDDILDNSNWIVAERRNYILNFIGKAVVRRADFVRIVSHEQEKYVVDGLNVPPNRVMWAPVRMDLEIFENADGKSIRSEITSRGFDRILLFVGRLVIDKNIGFLLQVFAKIVAAYPTACLILVGDGPERQKVRQTTIELGISENVMLHGWLPLEKVAEYMMASDVLLLASYQEAFGRVILEAGATGIPTISTDCIGPRELIQDGVTGYLVSLNDTDEMAHKVLFLLRNPDISKEMGRKAQQIVRKKYSPKQLAQLTVQVLCRTAQVGLRG